MTLATHIVIGAAVARPLMAFNPGFAFLAAFISHYLADAIPHWDYNLDSIADRDEDLKKHWVITRASLSRDITHAALDAFLGTAFIFTFFPPTSLETFLWAAATIMGAVLPDFLQGLFMIRRPSWMYPIQKFHTIMHTKIKLGPYPLIGIPFQCIIFIFFLYFLF
jgi:hypothetical protein